MRIRNIKNADELIYESPYLIKNPYLYIGEYKTKVFKNNNPIHLEIGMGKGNFIIDMAKNNPDINFIGVEKYSSITLRALRKLKDINLPNLKIINIDALELSKVFNELATKYQDRNGGYTRIIKITERIGDDALQVRLELV